MVPGIEGLSLHGTVRYFGKAPTDDLNSLFLPSHTTVNVGFQYATRIGGQAVTFTGDVNLLNKKYWDQTNLGECVNGSLGGKVSW